MLETKPQPIERTLRLAARPASRMSQSAPAASALPRSQARPAPAVTRERPERARHGSAADARLARSEGRLVTMAISCTVIVCALLVVYLAAYAHVTLLGMGQARLRTELRQKRLENEKLKADVALTLSPDRVAERATRLGMTREHRQVDYILLPSAALNASNHSVTEPATKTGGEAGLQVANSGPTADEQQPNHND